MEEKVGLTKTENYQIIEFSTSMFNDDEWPAKCYKKGDFKGPVVVWGLTGKSVRTIDSLSKEYEEILKRHGYQKADDNV